MSDRRPTERETTPDGMIRLDPNLDALGATLYLLAHDDHLGETVGRRATGRDIVEVLMAGPMPARSRVPEDFPAGALLAAVRRGVESGEIEGKVTRVEHDYYDHHASDGNLVKAGSYLVIPVGEDDDERME